MTTPHRAHGSTRRLLHIPDWLWARAHAIATAERGAAGPSRTTASASSVLLEAATGQRPPIRLDKETS